MRPLSILLLSLLSSLAAERPNILLIFADDHALQAISAYGGRFKDIAPTPNIDRLAKQGAVFERSYCANSICGPSRACILTGDMLSRLLEVMRGLRLNPQRMRANLDLGGGLIMAEAVMLDLGKALGRQHAHDVIYDAAQAAFVEGKSFSSLLAADARVTEHMKPAEINALLDPVAYTGHCATMAHEGAARARAAAATLHAAG